MACAAHLDGNHVHVDESFACITGHEHIMVHRKPANHLGSGDVRFCHGIDAYGDGRFVRVVQFDVKWEQIFVRFCKIVAKKDRKSVV